MITTGSLFSGLDSFGWAFKELEVPTLFQCDNNPYARMLSRQNFPEAVFFDDVKTADINTYVDVLTFGFPCQDISNARPTKDFYPLSSSRSGLFYDAMRIVRAVRPRRIIIENVPALLQKGFENVLSEIHQSGYDAEWNCLSAVGFGGKIYKERLFLVARPHEERWDSDSSFFRTIAFEAKSQVGRKLRTTIYTEDWGIPDRIIYGGTAETPDRVLHACAVGAIGNSIYYPIASAIASAIKKEIS